MNNDSNLLNANSIVLCHFGNRSSTGIEETRALPANSTDDRTDQRLLLINMMADCRVWYQHTL